MSAALTLVDFSQAMLWNITNPDPSMLTVGSTMTFNDVNGVVGCSVTVGLAGDYTGGPLLDADGFDNRTNNTGSNTWTVSFNQSVDFQIEMTTNHGPDETNTLGITAGAFDPGSYTVTGDTTGPPPTGSLPAVFGPGDTSVIIGPYSSATPNTGQHHPEWTLNGTGTGFTFQHEVTTAGSKRNQFQLYIEDVTHVPETSSTVLLGLASLALITRRRK